MRETHINNKIIQMNHSRSTEFEFKIYLPSELPNNIKNTSQYHTHIIKWKLYNIYRFTESHIAIISSKPITSGTYIQYIRIYRYNIYNWNKRSYRKLKFNIEGFSKLTDFASVSNIPYGNFCTCYIKDTIQYYSVGAQNEDSRSLYYVYFHNIFSHSICRPKIQCDTYSRDASNMSQK